MNRIPALRRELRQLRRDLPRAERLRHSRRIAQRLLATPGLIRRRRVALYLPADGEVDTALLLERLHARGVRCFLPVLQERPRRRLRFARYRPGDPLTPNRFGIPEPACRDRIDARRLDLVVLPLVAFDDACHRLGMGGGFYDRTLAFLRQRRVWRFPRLVGIAFELQHTAPLEPRPWDVPIDAVVTERARYRRHG